MFRVNISNFIKRNSYKIKDLTTKLIIVAIIIIIATIILSSFKEDNDNIEKMDKDIYEPRETIIKGSNISKEQYKEDEKTINMFLEYCNKGEIEKAYDLISDECKANLYNSLDIFKRNYYNSIFKTEKQCNLQSWISTDKYTIYQIRYTNNILATGEYEKSNIYQDYITLIKDKSEEKISIGSFIISEKKETKTITDEIEAMVIRKDVYLEDEEYDIYIKNKTEKTILLDNLKSSDNIKLVSSTGNNFKVYINEIFKSELTIKPGETKKITLKFKKSVSNSNNSKYIRFSNVIKDYESYIEDKENYKDIINIKINIY